MCSTGLVPKILHCASFCRSFVAHMGRILDMKALLTNKTKVFISSSNDKSIKVCENETNEGAPKQVNLSRFPNLPKFDCIQQALLKILSVKAVTKQEGSKNFLAAPFFESFFYSWQLRKRIQKTVQLEKFLALLILTRHQQ